MGKIANQKRKALFEQLLDEGRMKPLYVGKHYEPKKPKKPKKPKPPELVGTGCCIENRERPEFFRPCPDCPAR